MNYLIYCIFNAARDQRRRVLSGVGEKPVGAIVHGTGLGMVVSPIEVAEPRLNVADALIYRNVIETFFQNGPVVPLRFGCVMKDESQIKRHLDRSHEGYAALLKELDGCVEMGIRMLPEEENLNTGFPRKMDAPAVRPLTEGLDFAGRTAHPGHSYLAARKPYYARQEAISRENSDSIERIRCAFAGLFVKYRKESPCPGEGSPAFRVPMPSLYFLVPRPSLGHFRETFRQIGKKESAKLLLSGPWAPFNFVLPDRERSGNIPRSAQSP